MIASISTLTLPLPSLSSFRTFSSEKRNPLLTQHVTISVYRREPKRKIETFPILGKLRGRVPPNKRYYEELARQINQYVFNCAKKTNRKLGSPNISIFRTIKFSNTLHLRLPEAAFYWDWGKCSMALKL